jgi:hypothetical protein
MSLKRKAAGLADGGHVEQVAVDGFAADAERASKVGFALVGGSSLAGAVTCEGGLATGVGTAGLGGDDALALALEDQAHSNSVNVPITDSSSVAIGESSVAKAGFFLDELRAHALSGQQAHQTAQVIEVAREPVHRVARTSTVSPSRTNAISSSNLRRAAPPPGSGSPS